MSGFIFEVVDGVKPDDVNKVNSSFTDARRFWKEDMIPRNIELYNKPLDNINQKDIWFTEGFLGKR